MFNFTQLQFVLRLVLVLERHLKENGLSQLMMEALCGVLTATNSVIYSGHNVQEGGSRKTQEKKKKQKKSDLKQNVLT